TIKNFKSGVLSYFQKKANGDNVSTLNNFLFNNYNFSEKLLNKLDLSSMSAFIETKTFNRKLDTNFDDLNSEQENSTGGLISYLVLEIPHFKSDDITNITITAFPNTNNPNVNRLKGVM